MFVSVNGWEFDTVAPPPNNFCTDSKWCHQNKMAVLKSGYFTYIFPQWRHGGQLGLMKSELTGGWSL